MALHFGDIPKQELPEDEAAYYKYMELYDKYRFLLRLRGQCGEAPNVFAALAQDDESEAVKEYTAMIADLIPQLEEVRDLAKEYADFCRVKLPEVYTK